MKQYLVYFFMLCIPAEAIASARALIPQANLFIAQNPPALAPVTPAIRRLLCVVGHISQQPKAASAHNPVSQNIHKFCVPLGSDIVFLL